MSCYDAGDIVEILVKGSQTVLGEVEIHSKTCPKILAMMVWYKMSLEKGAYTHRKKRK